MYRACNAHTAYEVALLHSSDAQGFIRTPFTSFQGIVGQNACCLVDGVAPIAIFFPFLLLSSLFSLSIDLLATPGKENKKQLFPSRVDCECAMILLWQSPFSIISWGDQIRKRFANCGFTRQFYLMDIWNPGSCHYN